MIEPCAGSRPCRQPHDPTRARHLFSWSFATHPIKKNVRLFMNCLIGLVDGAHGRIDREADLSSLGGAAASNMTPSSFDYAPLCRTTNPISARARQGNYPSHTIALPNVISRPGEFTAPWREAFSAGKAPPSPRGAKVRPGRRRRWLARERRVAARAAGSPP